MSTICSEPVEPTPCVSSSPEPACWDAYGCPRDPRNCATGCQVAAEELSREAVQ